MTDGSAAEWRHGDPCRAAQADAATTKIVVDDRERGSGVLECLRGRRDLNVTVRRLELGDYLLGDRVLVERKTVADLAVSIADGRLFRQSCRMAGDRHIPVLIVEGASHGGDDGGVTRAAIQGAIVSLTLFLGIPCLRSRIPPETADLLRFIADQMRRKIARTVHRHGYRPKGGRLRQLFILQGLPGIGPARAERLLETFGNVETVFTAGAASLVEVAGIGEKTARAIRNLIAPPFLTENACDAFPDLRIGMNEKRDRVVNGEAQVGANSLKFGERTGDRRNVATMQAFSDALVQDHAAKESASE